MSKIKSDYDVVIIGSGLGGLITGLILSKEGYSVCVLEKNAQIGGTLQTFYFDKTKFDTGVHYIGGLEPGQPLHPYFKYLGLLDKIEYEKLEIDGFDEITFAGDPNIYPLAQGYDNFVKQLLKFFPHEEQGLNEFIRRIKEVCHSFSFYYIGANPDIDAEMGHFYIGAKDVIEDCVKDEKLRLVLAANNLLYAGEGDKAPFYIHALILNSYIESSFRVKGGGSKISNLLAKQIKALGGHIFRNKKVVSINRKGKKAISVQVEDGTQINGKTFISNLHPTQTFKLLETSDLRKSYTKRISELENTTSAFVLYLSLEPGKLPYRKANKYHFSANEVWNLPNYSPENWGKNFAIYYTEDTENTGFTKSLIVITYMRVNEVFQWASTYNTSTNNSKRSSEYQVFKEKKAALLFKQIESEIPTIKAITKAYNTSTPLTLKDYIGTDGSLYGVSRNYKSPHKSFVNTRTKIPNLLLTGQNIVMHGVLGVTIGAIVTCSEILGKEYLKTKIAESLT